MSKFKKILVILLITGCATLSNEHYKQEKAEPKYKLGDCLNVFDPETGKANPKDIVRVDFIGETRYYYRWWTYLNQWALELNTGIGEFAVFENMTNIVDCPDKPKVKEQRTK